MCDERGAADPRRGSSPGWDGPGRSGRASAGTSRPTCWWPARGSRGVYPIAACSFGDRVDAFFARDPFFHPSSYGGSELGAAVVEAVVGQVTEPGFLDHVDDMGARLAAGFDRLCAAHPGLLVGHRGLGLMRALDTVSPEACYRLMLEAIDGGLLVVWANNKQETLLVMPPLVVEADEVDEILQVLDRAAAQGRPVIEPGELRALEDEVSVALATRDPGRLPLLGHGEISLVLGWPPGRPEVACAAPHPSVTRRRGGATSRSCAATSTSCAPAACGSSRPTCATSCVPTGGSWASTPSRCCRRRAAGSAILRTGDPAHGHPIVPAVTEAVVQVTRLGVDAQMSNWAWIEANRGSSTSRRRSCSTSAAVPLDLTLFWRCSPPWSAPSSSARCAR